MSRSSQANELSLEQAASSSQGYGFKALQSEIQNIRKDSGNNETGAPQYQTDLQQINQQLHQLGLLPSLSLESTPANPSQPGARGKDGSANNGEALNKNGGRDYHGGNLDAGGPSDQGDHHGWNHDRAGSSNQGSHHDWNNDRGRSSDQGDHHGCKHDSSGSSDRSSGEDPQHSDNPVRSIRGDIDSLKKDAPDTDDTNNQFSEDLQNLNQELHRLGLPSFLNVTENSSALTPTSPESPVSPITTAPESPIAPITTAPESPTTPVTSAPEPPTSPITTTPESPIPPSSTEIPSGQFTVANGQIIGPDGKPFIVKGVAMSQSASLKDEAALLRDFPDVNTVRLATNPTGFYYSGAAPSSAELMQQTQQYINDMTKRGIVVEIDDVPSHNNSGPATGAALTQEDNWYAQLAAANKNNPYVWFQTPNEPRTTEGNQAVVNEQVSVYNAVRATGNNSMVLNELTISGSAAPMAADKQAYANEENVAFDYHLYDATPAKVSAKEASTAPITDAQGKIPAIFGEYGDTLADGTGMAPDMNTALQSIWNSGLGSIAWTFDNGRPTTDVNQLVSGNGSLTDYGQKVAAYIDGTGND